MQHDEETEFARRVFAILLVDRKRVKLQLDCRASCNVIRQNNLPWGVTLKQTNQRLKVYNGEKETPLKRISITMISEKEAPLKRLSITVISDCVKRL